MSILLSVPPPPEKTETFVEEAIVEAAVKEAIAKELNSWKTVTCLIEVKKLMTAAQKRPLLMLG